MMTQEKESYSRHALNVVSFVLLMPIAQCIRTRRYAMENERTAEISTRRNIYVQPGKYEAHSGPRESSRDSPIMRRKINFPPWKMYSPSII